MIEALVEEKICWSYTFMKIRSLVVQMVEDHNFKWNTRKITFALKEVSHVLRADQVLLQQLSLFATYLPPNIYEVYLSPMHQCIGSNIKSTKRSFVYTDHHHAIECLFNTLTVASLSTWNFSIKQVLNEMSALKKCPISKEYHFKINEIL